ncbi:aldehyde dehydrogenase family protein [Sulfitobacter porphyrae]|uniref:Aldehyde dehydrogenase family protein n=1 Tax=Sulfitobacter porphyrae TaxID=1246864 RepID=A0ABW2BBG0_9RHOB
MLPPSAGHCVRLGRRGRFHIGSVKALIAPRSRSEIPGRRVHCANHTLQIRCNDPRPSPHFCRVFESTRNAEKYLPSLPSADSDCTLRSLGFSRKPYWTAPRKAQNEHSSHPFPDITLPPARLLIGGEWVEAASGRTIPVINPATEQTFAHIAAGNAEDVDRAVKDAHRCFESAAWQKMRPLDRGTAGTAGPSGRGGSRRAGHP